MQASRNAVGPDDRQRKKAKIVFVQARDTRGDRVRVSGREKWV
jgi:hypothetical protein